MNVRKLDSVVVAIGVLAFFTCLGLSFGAVIDEGELTLKALAEKVLGVDKRVKDLEQRVAKLERSGTGPVTPPTKKSVIEITSPENGATLGMDIVVAGVVRVDELGDRIPVVGVHPVQTSSTWIQPLPVKLDKTPAGYVWRTRAYVGTRTLGLNQEYELFALLAKKGQFKEGDQLERLPTDIPVSPAIVVTRK